MVRNKLKLMLVTGDALAMALAYAGVVVGIDYPHDHGWWRAVAVVVAATALGLFSLRSQGLFLARVSAVRIVELTRSTRAMAMLAVVMIVVDRAARFVFRIRYIALGAVIA